MQENALEKFLASMLGLSRPAPAAPTSPTNVAGVAMPVYGIADRPPVSLLEVQHPDGRLSRYPPA